MTRFRFLGAAAVALVLGGGPAVAQQATPGAAPSASMSQFVEVEDDDRMVPGFDLTVDQMEDMDLYSADGERIGEIEEVLAATPGDTITAVTVDSGGFLGIGEREVIIGLDQITKSGDRLVTSLTKDELEKLPVWDD